MDHLANDTRRESWTDVYFPVEQMNNSIWVRICQTLLGVQSRSPTVPTSFSGSHAQTSTSTNSALKAEFSPLMHATVGQRSACDTCCPEAKFAFHFGPRSFLMGPPASVKDERQFLIAVSFHIRCLCFCQKLAVRWPDCCGQAC